VVVVASVAVVVIDTVFSTPHEDRSARG
jgi:hypothetical protein